MSVTDRHKATSGGWSVRDYWEAYGRFPLPPWLIGSTRPSTSQGITHLAAAPTVYRTMMAAGDAAIAGRPRP